MYNHGKSVCLFDQKCLDDMATPVCLSNCSIFWFCIFQIHRHSDCELDSSCPFLILIGCIKNLGSNRRNLDQIKTILCSIDQHFCSFSHFADFKSKFIGTPIQRIRKLMGGITMNRLNMDIL